jgi:putative two-component system response regulator
MVGFKVLIIDDDYINRKLLIEILKKNLYQVKSIESVDGEDALQQIHENPDIQLILLDIEMPKINGIDFLEYHMRYNQNNDIPIIAISSNDTRKKESLNKGASAFLTKPITEQQLMEAILSSSKD